MIDRSKCKEMWVWDYDDEIKTKVIVIDILKSNGCVAIKPVDNHKFLNGDLFYETEEWNHYEEIKEPKKRLMTRNEVLGFVEYNHIVVKLDEDIVPKTTFMLKNNIDLYQYATITADGIIGEWKKFEVEE